ncbi:hypothetical protein [Rhodococcus opacus]|uniref:hypothetical protein n=1 Tax=Rhodococcus opacus TaxID=37919 RepID=UPI001056EA2C|nr:hypothetical protein [Rhodococcus opacus]
MPVLVLARSSVWVGWMGRCPLGLRTAADLYGLGRLDVAERGSWIRRSLPEAVAHQGSMPRDGQLVDGPPMTAP